MRVIIYSDLHLYNHHHLLINSETALSFLSYMKDYAIENKIENIVCAGDFFHTKARAYAPHVIQGWLRIKDMFKANIKQYIIVGNHDMSNPNNTMNSILFMYSDYAKIIPDYYFMDIGDTRLHLLSYSTKMFENFILAEDKKNVLIGHLDVIGFTMSNGFRANAGFNTDSFSAFDLVVSGHYHMFQQRKNIIYIGSPYQTSFSEANQKHGFMILETDTLEWQFVEYNDAPKYKVIEVSDIRDLNNFKIDGNFVKIKLLTDKINKNQLRNSLFEMGAVSADIIPLEDVKEIEKYYDKALGTDPAEIAGAYIHSLSQLSLDKDKLLKYFDKIGEVANNISEYEI
jgi:DNA repair exonuclease SbcCD nuclease subunit